MKPIKQTYYKKIQKKKKELIHYSMHELKIDVLLPKTDFFNIYILKYIPYKLFEG